MKDSASSAFLMTFRQNRSRQRRRGRGRQGRGKRANLNSISSAAMAVAERRPVSKRAQREGRLWSLRYSKWQGDNDSSGAKFIVAFLKLLQHQLSRSVDLLNTIAFYPNRFALHRLPTEHGPWRERTAPAPLRCGLLPLLLPPGSSEREGIFAVS